MAKLLYVMCQAVPKMLCYFFLHIPASFYFFLVSKRTKAHNVKNVRPQTDDL